MAEINFAILDQTIAKMNEFIERTGQRTRLHSKVGASGIGEECERKIFYRFRNVKREFFNAKAIKSAEEGNRLEDIYADRLRKLDFIELHTINKQTNKQFMTEFCDGHFVGFADGVIKGLIESPKKWHIWEHKSKDEKYYNDLKKLRDKNPLDHNKVLHDWNFDYYIQSQVLMLGLGVDRHFMTVSISGGREEISLRTKLDKSFAERIVQKAGRIIHATTVPAKISENPDFHKCKMCGFSDICHKGSEVEKSCGTCNAFRVVPRAFFCDAMDCKIENQSPCKPWVLNPIFATERQKKVAEDQEIKKYEWQKRKDGD